MPDLDERALTEAAKVIYGDPADLSFEDHESDLYTMEQAIKAYLAALPEPPLDEWLKDSDTIEGVAKWLHAHAGMLERPGYGVDDGWRFYAWVELNENRREQFRKQARSLLEALAEQRKP